MVVSLSLIEGLYKNGKCVEIVVVEEFFESEMELELVKRFYWCIFINREIKFFVS